MCIRDSHIPSVWINSKQAWNCVRPDDFGAGRELTERLFALGHRRIAYADYSQGKHSPTIHYSAQDRYDGYADAMRRAGLQPERLCPWDEPSPPERRAYTRAWLQRADRPTAVVCYGGEAVLISLAALQLGLRIPADLSVAEMGLETLYDSGFLRMAGMQLPVRAVGERAARMLMTKIDRPARRLPTEVVPLDFVEGETVGRAPR